MQRARIVQLFGSAAEFAEFQRRMVEDQQEAYEGWKAQRARTYEEQQVYLKQYAKDYNRAVTANARAKAAGRDGYVSVRLLRRRMELFGRRCAYCRGPYEHVDHVVPLAAGGDNYPDNLVPACSACNLSKGERLPMQWTFDRFGSVGFYWVRIKQAEASDF